MADWSAGYALGPYVLVSRIGAGGMGEVWKARDTRLNRTVAVKRLKSRYSTRFEQEARAIAALNHPHICQIHDIGPDFLVLEYIEGERLLGPLGVEEAVRLATQIADALDAAHRKGIIHRDLKPANVMVTPEGSVKLLDFGLAKQFAGAEGTTPTETMEGAVVGTAAYMAPEQVEGKPLDTRADVFSFGAVFYELLSGRQAFGRENPILTIAATLHTDPPPLKAPPALQAIVTRCLAKRREDRFQTMGEVKAALRQAFINSPPDVAPAALKPSIAVLPFANLSADQENEYFGDGLAEEIINELAGVPGLKVTARTSSFFFKGKSVEFEEIGRRLHVDHILEGGIRKSGNRVRITAQLIKASDGFHLWSDRFDREMTDIFAVQDEITQAIASALRLRLSPKPDTSRRYLPNIRAYESYLRARQFWFSTTKAESLDPFRRMLEQAIEFDPKFALPYSFLGVYYSMQANLGYKGAREVIPAAMAAEREALRVDPNLPEAHAMLGVCVGEYEYDWSAAERHWRMAMAHEPVSRDVLFWYGNHHLIPTGRTLEALDAMERGLEGDPMNMLYRHIYARSLRLAGRIEEAETELRTILAIDSDYPHALGTLGFFYADRGRLEEALPLLQKAHIIIPWSALTSGHLAATLLRTGNVSQAEVVLQEIRNGAGHAVPIGLTAFHGLCGEIDEAAAWAERAIEQRYMPFVQNFATFFERTPVWRRLTKLLNLSERAASEA